MVALGLPERDDVGVDPRLFVDHLDQSCAWGLFQRVPPILDLELKFRLFGDDFVGKSRCGKRFLDGPGIS